MKKCVMFALCNLLCCGVPTFAQEWPARAVTWIVPFAAGGPTDQVSRYMASKLSLKIGQPVVAIPLRQALIRYKELRRTCLSFPTIR